jgi:hypothetical protein
LDEKQGKMDQSRFGIIRRAFRPPVNCQIQTENFIFFNKFWIPNWIFFPTNLPLRSNIKKPVRGKQETTVSFNFSFAAERNGHFAFWGAVPDLAY